MFIGITLGPGLKVMSTKGYEMNEEKTRELIRHYVGPVLPEIFAELSPQIMNRNVEKDGVQVQFCESNRDDINVADVWIVVRLSTEHPEQSERLRIRNLVFETVSGAFLDEGIKLPESFKVDVIWETTSSIARVHGKLIHW